jgi:hypothetical protein
MTLKRGLFGQKMIYDLDLKKRDLDLILDQF